jgi:hypothetical protein
MDDEFADALFSPAARTTGFEREGEAENNTLQSQNGRETSERIP